MKKICLICTLSLTTVYLLARISFAQPLDPSLPGYEEVRPPERPVIKIVSPEPGSTILGPKVTLEYILGGIKLVPLGERQVNQKGEGHLKIVFAKEGLPVPSPQVFDYKSPIPFESIPAGKYRITIEVVKNTGASYSPPVQATTKFYVVHPTLPTPTTTPTLTPTPIPLQQSLRKIVVANWKDGLLYFGVVLVVTPAIYLLLRK